MFSVKLRHFFIIGMLRKLPYGMMVIDFKMFAASRFRGIFALFKLVPEMYVSYYSGSQTVVSYNGAQAFFVDSIHSCSCQVCR
jgi:hypothetical protein